MDRTSPLISICIPAYKRPENIRRLLQSISEQTFKDFDVIISDDSPDHSVQEIIDQFELPIQYYKNVTPLGTPSNWNFAISKAKGKWIKIMHDDDWFTNERSLEFFAKATLRNRPFIFSSYHDVFGNGVAKTSDKPFGWVKRIVNEPVTLLARNVVGPPSVIMVRADVNERYDDRMKWRVDIDFYIRLLKKFKKFDFIDQPLVNVGISETQVTMDCLNVPEVELPEGLLLLNKFGSSPLRNIRVYDAWWRIIRNTGIRSDSQLKKYGQEELWPAAIRKMVNDQGKYSPKLLKMGIASKLLMLVSYLSNKDKFDVLPHNLKESV